jgi:DNA-binding transcriptional LysR family regulator
MNETVVPVVSRAFRDANAITTPQDLLRIQRLSMHSRPNAWKNWFNSQGISVAKESGMSFEHFSTLSQACIAGIGVALMPEFLIEPELERRDLVRVGESVVNDSAYYVAQPVQRGPNKAADLFKAWLLEEAGKTA